MSEIRIKTLKGAKELQILGINVYYLGSLNF